MTHSYARGILIFSNRKAAVRDVAFTVTEGERRLPHHSDFLNGRFDVRGTLVEECSPSSSLIARERVARLYVGESLQRGTVLDLLFLDFDKVDVLPHRRAYHWSFGVLNCRYDRLYLFYPPPPPPPPRPIFRVVEVEPEPEVPLNIDDLILSLGVITDATTNVLFDSEGGFTGFRG